MKKGSKILAFALAVCTLFLCACGTNHVHTYSEEWMYDENFHWQVPTCGDTNEVGNKSGHNFSSDGVCHLCGYSKNGAKESEFYNVSYAVDGGGGKVEGKLSQRVKNGGDSEPVEAVPEKGFVFIMWNDGEIEPKRQEICVKKDLSLLAYFQPDPDDPAIDDDENLGNDHPDDEEEDDEKKGNVEEADGFIFTEIKTITGEEVVGYSIKQSGYKNGDLVIPETHNELPVIEIDNNGFENAGITTVQIPKTVTKIGHQAFMNCGYLRKIEIPDSVLDVGNQSFQNCSSLASVKLSENMKGIWYKMFYRCVSLEKIVLPDSVESVGRYAFYYCSNLSSIKFGENFKKSGVKAFLGCTNLTHVEITNLRNWCEAEFDMFEFSGFSSQPLLYAHDLYLDGEPIVDLEIPDGTAMISKYAFMDCNSIKTAKIPGSVKVIQILAFSDCENLERIDIEEGLVRVEYLVFSGCGKLEEIKFPDTLETMGEDPTALEFYGSDVIEDCDSLKKITLGKGLKRIDFCLCAVCEELGDIYYNGTEAEWRQVEFKEIWLNSCKERVTLHCKDGREIVYEQKMVVENYLKFPKYFELEA